MSGSNRTPPGQTGPGQIDPTQADPAESGPPVAMGITDDRARAIKAGEETLGSGRATMVIIEVVRPGMAARTLAPCYIRTGVGWLGRRTPAGDVAWDRFFI
ncbi:MAG TPA: hypothetical protein VGD83_13920 [Streptosporangiaceae bacterium]